MPLEQSVFDPPTSDHSYCTGGGSSPNTTVNDIMSKAIVAALLSARGIGIGLCLLLIVFIDIDVINLNAFGVADTTTKCNRPMELMDDESSSARTDHTLRNLRLVFLGDSVMRYQYLSLAYYIRYGYWYDTSVVVNNLMNAHSFHHPFHPNEDWNEFFLQSNRILHPMEICDCIRGSGNINQSSSSASNDILVERRYFYDHRTNNMLVYINMNGIETSPGRGYYGRLKPETIFTPNFRSMVGMVSRMERIDPGNGSNDSNHRIEWEYFTWDDVIRHHIGLLDFHYNRSVSEPAQPNAYVLLNAGLHPHDFHNPTTIRNVVDALRDTELYGTWKTTTYTKVHVLHEQQQGNGIAAATTQLDESVTEQDVEQNTKHNVTSTAISDEYMCQALLPHECFNVSWILRLTLPISRYYVDNLHFMEPIYRMMNEEYLQQLSFLRKTYIPLNRTLILRPT